MKTKSQRQLQIGEQIKRVIADIFMRENLSIISGNYITVLQADVSPDIKNCNIYIDIFGDNSHNKKILEKLNLAAPNFRYELGRQINYRNTPEIKFILDKTGENVANIESLIEKEAKNFTNK